jgi:hypothetical protein
MWGSHNSNDVDVGLLKMEAVCFSETLVSTYKVTCCTSQKTIAATIIVFERSRTPHALRYHGGQWLAHGTIQLCPCIQRHHSAIRPQPCLQSVYTHAA